MKSTRPAIPTLLLLSTLALLLPQPTSAANFAGFSGYTDYPRPCTLACRNAIASAPLACTAEDDGSSHHGGHHGPATPPACYATDDAFLTTLAHCLRTRCALPLWQLEEYWASGATGDPATPAKWSYAEALAEVGGAPEEELGHHQPLNRTLLASEFMWSMQYKFMVNFNRTNARMNIYTLMLLVVGLATPIIITALAWLPLTGPLFTALKPYVHHPALIHTHHIRPLPYKLGNPPTTSQALYILLFFALNLILSSVGYHNSQPHPWGYNARNEIAAYVGYRTGAIAYGLLPLLILFSGRNNFLLWLTNWPHSTFVLLHRWVARIFVIQGVVHSVALLAAYVGNGIYSSNASEPYWAWGIVATVLSCAMLFISVLWVRQKAYEVFLLVHIVTAVLILVACWYHVYLRFGMTWSYDVWLMVACCVWAFERLMRVVRVLRVGGLRAKVTEVGEHHVRVDVEGAEWDLSTPGVHAYAFFPGVRRWRPWENHPFSVNATGLFAPAPDISVETESASSNTSSRHEQSGETDVEKSAAAVTQTVTKSALNVRPFPPATNSVTLLIKKSGGMTSQLQGTASSSLYTLLEGPYPKYSTTSILTCPRLLLVAGGIGITGILPYLPLAVTHSVKVAWSLKERDHALVKEVEGAFERARRMGLDGEVVVGARLDVEALMRGEEELKAQESKARKVGVVVCGPGGLCDEVRAEVARAGRRGVLRWELCVDAFSW